MKVCASEQKCCSEEKKRQSSISVCFDVTWSFDVIFVLFVPGNFAARIGKSTCK